MERLAVADEHRTVAARIIQSGFHLVVFGTVLPWQFDRGSARPGVKIKNWTEQYRVIVEQAQEWRSLRQRNQEAALIVAGDLNMDLGGRHFYGTAHGRALLRQGMSLNQLICASETPFVPSGFLVHPPIDHVLIPAEWEGHSRVVEAWEGMQEGLRLSDHSGLVVEVSCPQFC